MRASIDLPDELFRQLKTLAADRRVTLNTLVRRALENELAGGVNPAPRQRLRFPLLRSKEPGKLDISNTQIEELLTEQEWRDPATVK